jgi:hypothetical protein
MNNQELMADFPEDFNDQQEWLRAKNSERQQMTPDTPEFQDTTRSINTGYRLVRDNLPELQNPLAYRNPRPSQLKGQALSQTRSDAIQTAEIKMAKAIFGASETETNWDIRHYVKSIKPKVMIDETDLVLKIRKRKVDGQTVKVKVEVSGDAPVLGKDDDFALFDSFSIEAKEDPLLRADLVMMFDKYHPNGNQNVNLAQILIGFLDGYRVGEVADWAGLSRKQLSYFLEQHTAELKAYFALTLIIALIISNGSFHYIS